jgi:bacterial/archaeal transporter family-2 protein
VSRALTVLVVVAAGALVGMQAPVNARLGRTTGNLQAATLSFVIGTVALVAVLALSRGGFGFRGNLAGQPWWAFAGGLLGAVYVVVSILTVRTLGVSGLAAATIAGQLTIAVVIDRLGLLGIARQPIAPHRILGLALLAVGVALVVRR